jgi:hypothetical protein
MLKKNCFVKISGDACFNDDVLKWLKQLSRLHSLVVCVGGGTQINEAFVRAGLPVGEFGPLGRETASLQEKELAKDVLKKNRIEMKKRLADLGVNANVVIPIIDIGGVPCHVNGDQLILTAYHGFDLLYVITTKDRIKSKQTFFAPYKKIRVIGF